MTAARLLIEDTCREAVADGLAAIRAEAHVPGAFSPEAAAEAGRAAHVDPGAGARDDLRDVPFVTLDPLGSMDLDQAFHLEPAGEAIRLRYAIADVSARVAPGGPLDAATWERGTTVYLPDAKAPLYPTVLSEGAASLLPGQERPAIVLEVMIGPDGSARLAGARRSLIRSRAKLAYETATAADLPPLLAEVGRRGAAAERARGALRVDVPDQELVADAAAPGGFRLVLRPRLPSEDDNAALSLAANTAVADVMVRAGVGLLRVMPGPSEAALASLRRTAAALGIAWAPGDDLRAVLPRLDVARRADAAFLRAIQRANGGASYAVVGAEGPQTHAALATAYAHATAPLRRLADRYVLDLVLLLVAGADVPTALREAIGRLPDVMARTESVASRAERAAIDLVEAVELSGRVGASFAATVIDSDDQGARIQLADPPVRARLRGSVARAAGATLRVRLVAAEPAARRVVFEAVGAPATDPSLDRLAL